MNSRKKQAWSPGDVFKVPLSDGSTVIGQVLAHEPDAMNSVACAFFDAHKETDLQSSLGLVNAFSIILVTRDALDRGSWKIFGHEPIAIPRERFPYESLRPNGFIGARIVGAGIVNSFLHAFRGLLPWDSMADADYFDRLLTNAARKPTNLRLLKTNEKGD
jgi:hypothetical protein